MNGGNQNVPKKTGSSMSQGRLVPRPMPRHFSKPRAPDINSQPTAPSLLLSAPPQQQENAEESKDIKSKMESRLASMWNNMKFEWSGKMRTSFSKESPVWILGRCYHRKFSPANSLESSTEVGTDVTLQALPEQLDGEGIEGFKLDFTSRLWLTYRRDFPVLNGSLLTTDCGWGCMLRSGQMLLAQALICHFLGRSWRWMPGQVLDSAQAFKDDCLHRMIIKWFGDTPSCVSPLSIHQMVISGEFYGKKAGDWYGPASMAYILKASVAEASKEKNEFDNLSIYIAQDCTIYIEDMIKQCSRDDGLWKSVIILIPVRLGTEKFNPIYGSCLTSLLTLEQCIGIIGGRPKHSLYFLGFQEDKLIHLDPHYCQDMVDVWQPNFPLGSFHCKSPRKTPLLKMDPSCCIGFYCTDRCDFEGFINTVQLFLNPQGSSGSNDYPIFQISDGRSSDIHHTCRHRLSIMEADEHWTVVNNDSDTDFESEEFL